jgi:diguanylate cyclase (GGDEF)-like protein
MDFLRPDFGPNQREYVFMIEDNNETTQLKMAQIMIVDDEPINIDVVQAFLEEEGYTDFILLEDSTMALSAIESQRPDLLLLDLMMPNVSGFDILSAVRAHDKFKYLPVIILTAASDPQNKLKALGLGATDFLAKPLDQSELILRVRNTLAAKAYQDQLAYYDSLTNLPNRQLFEEEFGWAISTAERHTEKVALLNIEIDQFDSLNNRFGVDVGDQILKITAQRIQEVIRDTDFIARYPENAEHELKLFQINSSSFTVLLSRIHHTDNSAEIATRILAKISDVMLAENREIYVSASIGVALYPVDSENHDELLRLASSAKDSAMKMGGGNFQFFSPQSMEIYEQRQKLEAQLHKALDRNEFVLYLQPKVAVATGEIVGAEALIRWQLGEKLIPPLDFIPLAEETGLIIPIGKWCLEEGMRQLKHCHQVLNKMICMSINVSAKQFVDDEFMSAVESIVEKSGIDPQFITLEITESLLIDDIEQKISMLHKLKNFGFKLSIDDFGTGYSSLSYLRRLPVDELKIDRSFVCELDGYPESQAIVSTVVFLAKKLNLLTVAEGIEKPSELEYLQNVACDQYQGFMFSRPVPFEQFLTLL